MGKRSYRGFNYYLGGKKVFYKRDFSEYHPADKGWEKCGVWQLFKKNFPDEAARGEAEKGKYKNHGEFFNTLTEIKTLENGVELLFSTLVVKAEYLFCRLALQAEFGMNTKSVEQKLEKVKRDLKLLSDTDEIGNIVPYTNKINEGTSAWILNSMRFAGITDVNTRYMIANDKLYVCEQLQSITEMWAIRHIPRVNPQLQKIRWDGKFLVAIPDNTQKMLGEKLKALMS